MQQPEVNYPCRWPYRVIGADAAGISREITSRLSGYCFELGNGNVSRQGTYVSVHVEVEVASENERNTVFTALKGICGVKMVF